MRAHVLLERATLALEMTNAADGAPHAGVAVGLDRRSSTPLMLVTLEYVKLAWSIKRRGSAVSLSLNGLSVADTHTPNANYPVVVGTAEQCRTARTSGVRPRPPALHRRVRWHPTPRHRPSCSLPIALGPDARARRSACVVRACMSQAGGAAPPSRELLLLEYDTTPLVHRAADLRVQMKLVVRVSQPLVAVLNSQWLQRVAAFFDAAGHVDLRTVHQAAREQVSPRSALAHTHARARCNVRTRRARRRTRVPGAARSARSQPWRLVAFG
jgi:hypothetical protein